MTQYRIDDPNGRNCDGQICDTLEEAQRVAELGPGSYLFGPLDYAETGSDYETVNTYCWYLYESVAAADEDENGTGFAHVPRIVAV